MDADVDDLMSDLGQKSEFFLWYAFKIQKTCNHKHKRISIVKKSHLENVHTDNKLSANAIHTQGLHLAGRRLTAKSVWRFTAKSREVSRPRDWMIQCSYRYEIRQASRQRCCRCASQVSEQLQKLKPESRSF